MVTLIGFEPMISGVRGQRPWPTRRQGHKNGAPDGDRTHNLRRERPTRYPVTPLEQEMVLAVGFEPTKNLDVSQAHWTRLCDASKRLAAG